MLIPEVLLVPEIQNLSRRTPAEAPAGGYRGISGRRKLRFNTGLQAHCSFRFAAFF